MNNWSTSPIAQTNEIGRRVTPNSGSSPQSSGSSLGRAERNQLQSTEDLQKIRRSNHSAHFEEFREDVMDEDEDENDASIGGLMYPGLEASAHARDVDCDFFEEDYVAAQEAVRSNDNSMADSLNFSSQNLNLPEEHNNAVHRRSVDAFASLLAEEDSRSRPRHLDMVRLHPDPTLAKLGGNNYR